jgi:L-aminopeptidase/D-esterase-like protein
MTMRILVVLALSVTIGLIVGVAAGRLPGVGAFGLAALAGSAALALWQNHAARQTLERRVVPVRVERVVRDVPPPRSR